MPGVVVNTGVRVGPAGTDLAPESTFFVVGEAERGPIDEAVLVRSMTEFEKWYGNFVSGGTLHQQVQVFFEEGGTRCYVARALESGAASATVDVVDGADPAVTVFTVTAANKGAWGNSLSVTIASVGSGFTMTVTLKGVVVLQTGTLTTKAQAVAAINNNIPHIATAVAGASTALPDAGDYDLEGGSNTFGAPTDAEVVTALDLFGTELGSGAVAAPGRDDTTIYDGLRDHAKANKRIAICAPDVETAADAITAASAYYGVTDGQKEDASYMAFYWPHVVAPDGSGGSRTISPEGFVAAARAKAHLQAGAWRAGAGLISAGSFVTGIEHPVNKATGEALDLARVNALRIIDNTVRVYGARSVSADEDNWRFITFRDTINLVASRAEAALEDYVFSVIDGRKTIFAKVASELVSILEPIRQAGGVFEALDNDGRPIDRGYSVDVSNALNPVADLASGIVRANVGVRVSSVADLITVTITKSGLTTAV